MNRLLPLLLLTLCVGAGAACTDNNEDNNTSNNTTPDATVDTPDDTPEDTSKVACAINGDCSDNESCLGGFCQPPIECRSRSASWRFCANEFNKVEPGSGSRAICDGSFCQKTCVEDTECSSGQICADDGRCVAYTRDLNAPAPGGEARAALKVGVSSKLFDIPIGMNNAGFGGGNAGGSRYVDAMEATAGQFQGLYNRAIALDNGQRQLVFLRSPIIFPTGPLHEEVAHRLQVATGKNWRDSLVISGTHTHSGPGRHLHLPDVEAPLGVVGTDLFNEQAFQWFVDDMTQTALDALSDLEEGSLGWKVVEGFDEDDELASDRWSETPAFDDNRALLIRLDDAQGQTKAVMVSFALHGIWNSKRKYYATDAPGAMEYGLEKALGRSTGKHVPVLFFNSNGGSISPRGDRLGHKETHKFELSAEIFGREILPEVESIQTKTDIDLGGVTHRFSLSYEKLGYKEGQFTDLITGDPLYFGGLECRFGAPDDRDPATYGTVDEVKCLSVSTLLNNQPATIFARSQISAMKIDDLTIMTLPGESVVEYGWQVVRTLNEELGLDPLKTFVFGYAQDHKFYITPRNLRGIRPPYPGLSLEGAPDDYPDYAISYYQGGYEAGFMPWGPQFPDFLAKRTTEAAALLIGDPVNIEGPDVGPMYYSPRADLPFEIDLSTDAVGSIVQGMPEVVTRLNIYEMAWVGGDPGAERPQAPLVTLERQGQDGTWAPVIHDTQRPYNNRQPLMVTRTRKTDTDWEWVVRWEELKSFPVGEYRFVVQGHYQDAEGRKPYTLTEAFTLAPSTGIEFEAQPGADGSAIVGRVKYPRADQLDVVTTPEDPGAMTGTYRLPDLRVPSNASPPVVRTDGAPQPMTATFTQDGATVAVIDVADLSVADETVQGRANVPVSRFSVPLEGVDSGDYKVELSIVDQWGNTGSQTFDVTVP